MKSPLVFFLIVSCFASVIHLSALADDPKPATHSKDPKPLAHSKDSKPASHDSKNSKSESHHSKDAKIASHDSKDLKSDSHDSKDSKSDSHKSKDSKSDSHKSKDSKSNSHKFKDSKSDSHKSKDSKSDSHDSKNSKSDSHKSKDSKSDSHQSKDSKSDSHDSKDSKSDSHKYKNSKSESHHSKDSKSASHSKDSKSSSHFKDSKSASHDSKDSKPASRESKDPKPASQPQDAQPVVPPGLSTSQPQGAQPVVPPGLSTTQPQGAQPVIPPGISVAPPGLSTAPPQGSQPVIPPGLSAAQPQGAQPVIPPGLSAAPPGLSAAPPQGSQPVIPPGLGIAQPQAAQPAIPPGLSEDYYAKTCPNLEKILLETITPKQNANPTTAAATLRVFFHDCFVEGCDGSVLVNPTPGGNTERDNPLNLDLPGDAFDVIVRTKQALDIACPGVVSCSDILAIATRQLIKLVGGPSYKVLLGKKDGKVSIAQHVDHNLTDEKTDFDTMLAPFIQKGFTVRDMVALLGGGHTIGFAHCSKFAHRLFKFSPTQEIDPALNPAFAQRLRTLCADYIAKPELAAFMDPLSAGEFDNNFFLNVMRGLDILPSDHLLLNDPRSKPIVEEYAKDQNKFFADFVLAMEKLNVLGVKTGADGEIRTNCFAFNKNP